MLTNVLFEPYCSLVGQAQYFAQKVDNLSELVWVAKVEAEESRLLTPISLHFSQNADTVVGM